MTREEIFMIAGMMAVTFSIRYILLALADHFTLPPVMQKALGYVPPAVLTAITVPAVLMPKGTLDLSWENPYLFGACAAVAAGILYRKQTLLASICTGLAVFFLWWHFFL